MIKRPAMIDQPAARQVIGQPVSILTGQLANRTGQAQPNDQQADQSINGEANRPANWQPKQQSN
jgi:hypothetical protein